MLSTVVRFVVYFTFYRFKYSNHTSQLLQNLVDFSMEAVKYVM